MKTITSRHLILGALLIFLVACSTKRNSFLSRNSHALSTKYNILYNGGIALDKGVSDLKTTYNDNFWELLPVERMQVSKEAMLPGQTPNPNFERAETKSVKAIQKHSMNIDGSEKNPQMDEAHLMLGKARYYDQRFIPALEAFNYVLYKYPSSDKIYEVKIWRERTNMRLENDAQAVTNLRKLLKEIKFKDQIFADANATLAQAFLNLEEKDSAIARLKIATEFTKENEEKARYRFILAQLYDQMGHKDSAYATYQEVIDMNRRSPRQYVIQSHIKQALQFDYATGDTLAFVKKYKNLLEDRENRPYLDFLNHQMGLFYDKQKNHKQAEKYYNISLNSKPKDNYLIASNHRNLADIYFKKAKYVTTGKYFDSTLAVLDPRSREHKLISKKRENLEDVIKFEGIAQRNDSLLKMAKMSPADKDAYFKEHIAKLKEEDKKLKEKLALEEEAKSADNPSMNLFDNVKGGDTKPQALGPKAGSSADFYFYNQTTVAYGRTEFAKKWGKRSHDANWRLSSLQKSKSNEKEEEEEGDSKDVVEKEEARFTTDYYIKDLPSSQKELDSIAKERNFAYYQLGVIYKEKFKEYKLAASKLETLLQNNPEERLVLPAMYNLFKIYEIIDPAKAIAMKGRIISEHPSSRYAQILNDNSVNLELGKPEVVYASLYKDYEAGLLRETLTKTDMAVVEFAGEEMLPKFELLKANLIGKLFGLAEYKKALNFVALTYPNSQEGKETEKFIATKIPMLEALYFDDEVPTSWKIIYQPKSLVEKDNKVLLDKLNKLAKERTIETLTVSTDVYTMDKNLIVVHGITSKENARGLSQVLKEFKEYKINDPAVIISSENYKIVQIFKNLEEYSAGVGPNFEPKQKPTITLPKEEVKVEKPKAIREQKPDEVRENSTKGEIMKNETKGTDAKGGEKGSEKGDDPGNMMMPPSINSQPKRG
ncbi:MAG: gliding motility protein [Flavobacteriales bacterium]|nr:gliding motility protein [Flavobacteriales bacterium]